jgi:hypothetical protein
VKTYGPTIVALAAIASVTIMVMYDKVNGEAAFGLLSAIIGAGVLHAGVTTTPAGPAPPPDQP